MRWLAAAAGSCEMRIKNGFMSARRVTGWAACQRDDMQVQLLFGGAQHGVGLISSL